MISGVKLEFNGKARVHWTERHSTGSGKNRRTETRHYSATEQYFNFEVLLFGPGGCDSPGERSEIFLLQNKKL